MRIVALVLVAVAISPPQGAPEDRVDPILRRVAAEAPDRAVTALVKLRPGQRPPALPGVTYSSRAGSILTARGTAKALAALGAQVDRVEAARRCRPRTDVSGASTIGFRGSTTGETDSYTFSGVTGQSVRVRVDPEGSLDPLVTITDGATVTSDDNSGPGSGARLDVTWATTGSKTIDVSPVGGTTGDYVLLITANTPIAPGDLTGGDIGATTPHYAGTRAREARAIEGLDGAGVLVGFVDTGIDHTHADFRRSDGSTRLVGIWDQTLTATAGESVPSPGYGVYYKEAEINIAGFVRSKDTDGHGSRVAAIAAGDDATFPGAAPNAQLLMVKTDGTTTGLIDGVNLIIDRAEKLEFDAVVVNLSLGTHDGPHDGTSLLDQALSAATGRARHIVCAAGNESDPATAILHAKATIGSSVTWTFTPSSAATHTIDMWADGADTYTVTMTDGSTSLTTPSGSSGTVGPTLTVTSLTIDNRVDSPSNGATHIRIELTNLFPFVPWSITLTRTASGGSGVVDGYVASESGTFAAADITLNADGSVPGVIVEPATAAGTIAVGAYRGKFTWDTAAGTTVKSDGVGAGVAGNIALFSSRGPARDGRTKPDISAPGAYIAGARSADASPAAADVDADGVHFYGQGTSFAAPQVAGVVALLLQKNRLLTNDELKARLGSTALADGFVTTADAWGAGKVDAVALLASVFTQVDVTADAGHCFQAAPAQGGGWTPLACLVAALVALLLRRTR